MCDVYTYIQAKHTYRLKKKTKLNLKISKIKHSGRVTYRSVGEGL